MMESTRPVRSTGPFQYVESTSNTIPPTAVGAGQSRATVLLLHGMIGGPGNWDATVEALEAAGRRVLVPRLPVFERSADVASVTSLARYARGFLDAVAVDRVVAVGNSLGGHVATMLCLEYPERVAGLVLLGSSGIDELDMGVGAVRRNDRAFLRERAEITFHDPVHVTERLLDEIVDIINDRSRASSLIRLARSVKQEGVAHRLGEIRVPTLIVWGREDRVTPPAVAERFAAGIADATLHWVEQCGHAPMMERPEVFQRLLAGFLARFDD